MSNYKYFCFLILSSIFLSQPALGQNAETIQALKDKAKFSAGTNRINALNDLVDEMLKPEPAKENCLAAKDYAHDAAKQSEVANYKVGMARSYEQLTLIYKTLDYQIHYVKWKAKAALVPRGEEIKVQQKELEKQNDRIADQQEEMNKQEAEILKKRQEADKIKREIELLAKDNILNKDLILQKQKELVQKEAALTETTKEMEVLNEEKEHLAMQNKLLEQDTKIKEMEVKTKRAQNKFLMVVMGAVLILLLFLFNLFRVKQRTAKELAIKNKIIEEEKIRSDELLLNILPFETANELKATGKASAQNYENVTVLLSDFKDFTIVGEKLTPTELVDEIDYCFSAFDAIMEKYGIEKIKTIGDAYLCAVGLPKGSPHDPHNMILAAKDIIAFMNQMKVDREAVGKTAFSIRIGIHTGPLVAGVVGKKKFAYDIWGDTVNTAARMEQTSEPGRINVSEMTYNLVKDKFDFVSRGKIEAKNKGPLEMYFLVN
jgi:class 3 adenylate cyclase